ncbi:MAG: hypothetical protein WC807_12750 [Hyphomicrobium sp.]
MPRAVGMVVLCFVGVSGLMTVVMPTIMVMIMVMAVPRSVRVRVLVAIER